MCGIVGIFGRDDPASINKMLAITKHRGKDDTHSESWGEVCRLGINRLSIVDVKKGRQPISDASDTIHLVCNGEIYNHQALREDLSSDHKFKTGSDAEVVVHLYTEYGEECVHYLDGMFGFILYDSRKKTFLAARDRFGIKPLYYAHHEDCWYFSSEAKAFLCLDLPPDRIQPLSPGSKLTLQGVQSWFSLDMMRQKSVSNQSLLRVLLEHTVKKHLMCDKNIKIGTFLSGGIDSSIITALAAKFRPDIVSFTVGMEDSPDVTAAKKVAQHLDIKHVIVPFTLDDVLKKIPEAIYFLESYNPILALEGLMTMMMAEAARDHGIKILLSGEGADEIFAGYSIFRHHSPKKVVSLMRSALSNLHNTECLRIDRATMAFSVEARVPFLDPQLVQYALNLPITELIRNVDDRHIEKWILRYSCEDLLPSEFVWREKAAFDDASGVLSIDDRIDQEISAEEYLGAQKDFPEACLSDKTSLYLYKIWRNQFGKLTSKKTFELFGSYPHLQEAVHY